MLHGHTLMVEKLRISWHLHDEVVAMAEDRSLDLLKERHGRVKMRVFRCHNRA